MLKGKEEPRFLCYPLTVTLAAVCEYFNLGDLFVPVYFSFGPIGLLLMLLGIRMLWRRIFGYPA